MNMRRVTRAFTCLAICCLATTTEAGIQQYTTLGNWQAAVGTPDVTLTFGDYATNTLITNQYASQGVTFSGSAYAANDAILNNKIFEVDDTGPIEMAFLPNITAVAMDLLGAQSGTSTISLFSGAMLLTSESIPPTTNTPTFFGFQTTAGMTIDRIVIEPGIGTSTGIYLDNLQFVQQDTSRILPEPSTFALLSIGFCGFMGYRKRRSNRSDRQQIA